MILEVLATAYCLVGRTSGGTYTHRGTIAVDPKVIKLGTRIRVPGYGRGRALDTGSDIKGARIDLWMPSCYLARQWGVRKVKIHFKRR